MFTCVREGPRQHPAVRQPHARCACAVVHAQAPGVVAYGQLRGRELHGIEQQLQVKV